MIDEDLFQDFIGHRKDIKKPMTDRAVNMLYKKLQRLELQGYCPSLLIERSMINGWQDVFPHDSCKKNQSWIDKVTDKSWREGLDNVRQIK